MLRATVDAGVTHIDTSDFYGPATVNEAIREALHQLLIPGTSSVAHLRENLAAVDVVLPPAAVATLDRIAGS